MKDSSVGCMASGGAFLIVCFVTLCLWGCPQYLVYEQRLSGVAKLAEADSSRQIAIAEAKAKLESAKMLAEAEIERAKGVAEANKIIGESLQGNESYLHYLWIQELAAAGHVIYVPTEANLPILEASRFSGRSE